MRKLFLIHRSQEQKFKILHGTNMLNKCSVMGMLSAKKIVKDGTNDKRVVQGGSLARLTDEKTNESRITDIEISFSRITKISTLLSCSYATNSV